MNMNIKNMKQYLLITLAILILILFMFSGDVLLKINESVLGKIFFTILIILYAHENTMYGLFIAILFFIVNEKFTYAYHENMIGSIYEPTKLNVVDQKSMDDVSAMREKINRMKPTSCGVIELSEQMRSSNPRSSNSIEKYPRVTDTDIINMIAIEPPIQTSNFQTIPSSLDSSNLYDN